MEDFGPDEVRKSPTEPEMPNIATISTSLSALTVEMFQIVGIMIFRYRNL
jgi:hypothetical protein